MSIDEAIEHARGMTKKCRTMAEQGKSLNPMLSLGDLEIKVLLNNAEEHEQLADWLEELKIFKELYPDTNIKSSLKTNYNNGWNDAIDNFKDSLLANEVVDRSVVKRVATQLKV